MSSEAVLFLGLIGLIPIYFLGCKFLDHIIRKEYDIPLPSSVRMYFLLFLFYVAYGILCLYEDVYM